VDCQGLFPPTPPAAVRDLSSYDYCGRPSASPFDSLPLIFVVRYRSSMTDFNVLSCGPPPPPPPPSPQQPHTHATDATPHPRFTPPPDLSPNLILSANMLVDLRCQCAHFYTNILVGHFPRSLALLSWSHPPLSNAVQYLFLLSPCPSTA